jgi:uncharacterized protein YidB (DUF937 family)
MGLLDEVMGMAGIGGAGDAQSPQHAGALAAVLEYINSPQVGGISGLQQMFQQKGLGGMIASWIGTGQNLPISPDQLQNVLHSDVLQNIVAKTGLDRAEVASLLSQALPHIVDQLTPNGQVPEPNALARLTKGLAAQA